MRTETDQMRTTGMNTTKRDSKQMSILYSKKTRTLAGAYSLTPEELAFADLIAAGWDVTDAYFVAFRKNETWTANAIAKEARMIMAKIGVKKRIKELRRGDLNEEAKSANNIVKAAPEGDEDVMKALSKENMLRDLYLARKKMTVGSKDWLDTNKMIADITRMKQEEVKTEDNTVHFFLPLTCEHCSLYLEARNNAQYAEEI